MKLARVRQNVGRAISISAVGFYRPQRYSFIPWQRVIERGKK